MLHDTHKPFNLEDFPTWLKSHTKPANTNSVMRTVQQLHSGMSVSIGTHTYQPLLNVRLTPEMVDDKMCDDARDWAPRGKKNNEGTLCDPSNGWKLHHPLKKLLKYKREVLQPRREREEVTAHMPTVLTRMRLLDDNTVRNMRKKRTWTVRGHDASNTEQTTASAPFLACCLEHAKQTGYTWSYVEEMPFGNRQRCDLFLACDACQVVVESKTNNLLHGLGQVLHYDRLALDDIPGYADAPRRFRMVVLARAARPYEIDTAAELGVHVWWPDGPKLPEFMHPAQCTHLS